MGVQDGIKKLREKHDLTQEQFGKIAGVSAMAVSQWENGRAVPRMTAIRRITDYFNVPMSSIVDDVHYAHIALDKQVLEDDERELMRIYEGMDESHRRILLETARSIEKNV